MNGANGDQVGTTASPIDALLGPLQDNGGPTLTMALLPGSPALGTGACTDAQGAPLPVDQRGFPRPQVTGCDIGAFENQAPTLICPVAQCVPDCTPQDGTLVTLTARVADPDGDALVVIWSVNGVPLQTNDVAATHPPRSQCVTFTASYPQGTNIVSVVVSDGKAVPLGCSTSVIVRDPKPPRIHSIKANPAQLWPPNGKLVPVTVTVQAVADCGPVTSRIVSVSSNEPPDGTWARLDHNRRPERATARRAFASWTRPRLHNYGSLHRCLGSKQHRNCLGERAPQRAGQNETLNQRSISWALRFPASPSGQGASVPCP